jgi:hypothetical protein
MKRGVNRRVLDIPIEIINRGDGMAESMAYRNDPGGLSGTGGVAQARRLSLGFEPAALTPSCTPSRASACIHPRPQADPCTLTS